MKERAGFLVSRILSFLSAHVEHTVSGIHHSDDFPRSHRKGLVCFDPWGFAVELFMSDISKVRFQTKRDMGAYAVRG